MPILDPHHFGHYVAAFNAMEPCGVVNLIPDCEALNWMQANVPFFSCPDTAMEELYYFRWWSYRKHIKQTPYGKIITEFIEPVRHAGTFNSISCAVGHHIAEGRWLKDQTLLDEYIRFWFRSNHGRPEWRFHRYSSWIHSAIYDRFQVTGDSAFVLDLLDDLHADYLAWEAEKMLPSGLFWQYDVWDGMEESISGSRKHKNARPTINSYMYGNAIAMQHIALLAGNAQRASEYAAKAIALRKRVQEKLWDSEAQFFKAQTAENGLSTAREAIGLIPWCFNLPEEGFENAWKQFTDPEGFWAPFGLATAERRHPQFRTHGVGKCEWDGAAWPFATSQTLGALANLLRNYSQSYVAREHFMQAMEIYVHSQRMNGQPYIGEYLDETNGDWLKGDNPRSRFYNHSTFADLVIGGLIGIVPRTDSTVEISPLLPAGKWDWFCLDQLPYHGRQLCVLWDRDGSRFHRGSGLILFDGETRIAHSPELTAIRGDLK